MKKNITWLTNLRAIATISIILLHVSAQLVHQYGKVPDVEWWASNLYENINRFAVPSFVIMTGFLILGRNETLGTFLKKRFSRILIPFIFWGVIYIIYYLSVYYLKHGSMSLNYIGNELSSNILKGYGYHTWYVYMLIGLYLAYPIINKFILHSNKNELHYFLFLCLITIFISYIPFKININLSFFSKWSGLLILGYYLKTYYSDKKRPLLYMSLFLISYALICYFTYYRSKEAGRTLEFFHPIDIIQAVSVFLLFMKIKLFNRKSNFLAFVSKYSYGIYLVHVLIISIIAKLGLGYYTFNPYFSIPIITVLTFAISLSLLYILDKYIPYGKYITK